MVNRPGKSLPAGEGADMAGVAMDCRFYSLPCKGEGTRSLPQINNRLGSRIRGFNCFGICLIVTLRNNQVH